MVMLKRTFDEDLLEESIRNLEVGYGLRGELHPMYTITFLSLPHYYEQYVTLIYGESEIHPPFGTEMQS